MEVWPQIIAGKVCRTEILPRPRSFRRGSVPAHCRGRRPRRPAILFPKGIFRASERGSLLAAATCRLFLACLRRGMFRAPERGSLLAAYPAKAKIYADRRTTNRLYVSPRCRSRVPRGDALVYRLCGGVLACRFTKCASQQRVSFYIPRPNWPHLHLLPAAASARFDNRLYR